MADWKQDALLIVGHGSEDHPGALGAALAHAEAIRRRRLFAAVAAGFLNGCPSIEEALAGLAARRVHVVPHAMTVGYLTQTAIPRRLGLNGPITMRAGRCLVYGPPPGLSPRLAGIVTAKLVRLRAERGIDPAALRLILVGHGSRRGAAAEAATRLAADLERRRLVARVEAAFIEQAPHFSAVLDRSSAACAVAGFLAAEGYHAEVDLRVGIAAARARGREVHYLGALGADPAFAELILDAVAKADRA